MKLAAPCLARHSSPARSMVIILTSRAQMHTARTGSSCVGRGLPFGSASASFPGFENACPATVYWGLSPSSSKSILARHIPEYRTEVPMRREPGLCRTKLDQPCHLHATTRESKAMSPIPDRSARRWRQPTCPTPLLRIRTHDACQPQRGWVLISDIPWPCPRRLKTNGVAGPPTPI
jgi:hypothetical protein